MIHDSYVTLHPSSDDRSLQQGFEAAVHDPAWFLARQWQMGEHQGENASTPMLVRYKLRQTAIPASAGAPLSDPTIVPAEAIVESEPDDWWTMGRRLRVGRRLLARIPPNALRDAFFFRAPPPPYESFNGSLDGLQLWRNRATLLLTLADFGPDALPTPSDFAWNSADLHYDRFFPRETEGLAVRNHRGGLVDWFSVDAERPPAAGVEEPERSVLPSPLEYPGAPANRFWQIEDADVDVGGYPPDVAHFPTMLLVDLIYSHSDDWFLMPVTARAGHIVSLSNVVVSDSFNREYASTDPRFAQGLTAPAEWSLYRCSGLDAGQLVIWNAAEMPIESLLLEQVQFGVDEASNLIWAVEKIIDGRDSQSTPAAQSAEAGQTPKTPPAAGDMTTVRAWRYQPSDAPQPFWHPYIQQEGSRQFVLHGLADLTLEPPKPLPHPEAEILRVRGPDGQSLHQLSAATIPSNGISLERRWMLARDIDGNPVLWIQRQRQPLLSPPARRMRFDLVEDSTS